MSEDDDFEVFAVLVSFLAFPAPDHDLIRSELAIMKVAIRQTQVRRDDQWKGFGKLLCELFEFAVDLILQNRERHNFLLRVCRVYCKRP
jgi:hypothetical protein